MKLLLLPVLLVFACLLAALYGALHNQISYSVAPGYFHDLKFQQFRIDPSYHNRLGAAQVGVSASWWMGIVIGVPIYVALLRISPLSLFIQSFLKIALTVVIITLVVGLIGLLISTYAIDPQTLLNISPERNTDAPLAFARAGAMHDFSYIGGILGLCVGLFHARRIGRNQS
ncbi:hypothetical protein [Cognatishimia activa]|uniref:hypothetical protein n=1 Tax=Cognatishimia activa TaxID=1715691 RepID=UPI0006EEF46B|nr:hypothetical protein [Cognatishimia activa]CUJ34123.1 hypothetical protein TA5113_03099 [Cognatishimia activa]